MPLANSRAFRQVAASSASRWNQAWRAATLSRRMESPGSPSQADARNGIASSVRPSAMRASPRIFRSPGVARASARGDGCANGSRGKPASAIMPRKSARPRSGSRSRSVATGEVSSRVARDRPPEVFHGPRLELLAVLGRARSSSGDNHRASTGHVVEVARVRVAERLVDGERLPEAGQGLARPLRVAQGAGQESEADAVQAGQQRIVGPGPFATPGIARRPVEDRRRRPRNVLAGRPRRRRSGAVGPLEFGRVVAPGAPMTGTWGLGRSPPRRDPPTRRPGGRAGPRRVPRRPARRGPGRGPRARRPNRPRRSPATGRWRRRRGP